MSAKAIRVNITAPADVWRRFDKVAKHNDRSRSAQLRVLMLEAIAKHAVESER